MHRSLFEPNQPKSRDGMYKPVPGVALKASRIAGFASLGSPSWTFALRGAS
jgi:hypothetical protein